MAVARFIPGGLLAGTRDETFFLDLVSSTGHAPTGLGVMALSCVELCGPGTGGGRGGNRTDSTQQQGRRSVTAINLESPSATGQLEELME